MHQAQTGLGVFTGEQVFSFLSRMVRGFRHVTGQVEAE